MSESKPKLFVASSAKSREIAYEIASNLDDVADVTPWAQLFEISDTTIESLVKALDVFDFGVFVFTPDDVATLRGKRHHVVRDNVLFELGLFIGRLGKKRNFIVRCRNVQDFQLPTDLLGVTVGEFDASRQDVDAAIVPVCHAIRKVIRRDGIREKTHHLTYEQLEEKLQQLGDGIENILERAALTKPTPFKERLNLDLPKTAAGEAATSATRSRRPARRKKKQKSG